MKLTPLDIKKQEFRKTLRGFDPVEVDTFLEMVADEYEDLLKERNRLKEEVIKLQTQLQDYQQVEHTLKETLMNAQESIKRARMNSEKEGQMIIREAELKSDEIIGNAHKALEKMKNELMLIKTQKDSFSSKLRHLIQSQLELIEILEKDDFIWPGEKKPAPQAPASADKSANEPAQEAGGKPPKSVSDQLII
ncbi:septum site-determining protein DivIVA [bacterium BMS3Abin05]|nr:septum site-determining protein DivIVA [bacterium BMS3Abin05]GBE26572.1 septum site-determining protein DivIVA [bacterium BMS3Bbin03]